MTVFEHPDFDDHEQVIFCSDVTTGLHGIIAIHSTARGPAAGGCRMYPYGSLESALTDVLRLSKGMSYKNAVAGLPLGGGKGVIIADPSSAPKAALLGGFARHVQSLAGRYWTAIDIGVGPTDADIMAEHCDYIFARASQYEPGFNPSSFTALGGFVGIKAAVAHVFNRTDLKGIRVAIQGLGASGGELAKHLHEAGAMLVVSDVRQDAVDNAIEKFGAIAVNPDEIHASDVDVFAPCAMGAVLNESSIEQVQAKVICGLANNQLHTSDDGARVKAKGIAYVPDYVVNAGGMMGASTVIFDTPSYEKSIDRIHGLHETISDILRQSDDTGQPSSAIADNMARVRIQAE